MLLRVLYGGNVLWYYGLVYYGVYCMLYICSIYCKEVLFDDINGLFVMRCIV